MLKKGKTGPVNDPETGAYRDCQAGDGTNGG
jgi:hypothetical protein